MLDNAIRINIYKQTIFLHCDQPRQAGNYKLPVCRVIGTGRQAPNNKLTPLDKSTVLSNGASPKFTLLD